MSNFIPAAGRILVLPDKPESETSFGFLVPDSKEKPATGVVVVGNDFVKAGDKILFSLFGLDEVKIDGQNYAVVTDSGVLGKYA